MKTLKCFVFIILACLPAILSAQTLIGSWQFSGNANDISGNNLNGTVYNATLTAGKDGIPNTAYLFNGYSSHIDVPYSALLNLTTWTIETTVRVDGFNSSTCQQENIVARGSEYTGDNIGISLNDNTHDQSCAVYSPNNTQFLSGVAGTPAGSWIDANYIQLHTWYDITFTYDGIYSRLYVNGVIIDSIAWSNQYSYGSTQPTMSFGYYPPGGTGFPYWFNGAIDNISIWQGALSSTTINNNYNSVDTISINQPFTDTVVCWGSTHQLHYTVSTPGVFQPGNTFTAQLSDEYGSFFNPTNIGSVTDTTSGVIPYTIPVSIPYTSNGYRIRIVSSNPQIYSQDDQRDILIYTYAPPSVSIALSAGSGGSTGCAGSPLTFVAEFGYNGIGQFPTIQYQWKKNGIIVGTDSMYYTDSTLVGTDVLTCTCILAANWPCLATNTFTGFAYLPNIQPVTIPTVTTTANPATPVCAGTPITFTAVTNAGSGAAYQWQKNGLAIPNAILSSYTDNTLAPGDQVACTVTTNATCSLPATSAAIAAAINPLPVTTITAQGPTHVCIGDSVILQCPTGNNTYQWSVDGTNIAGAASNTYVVQTTGNYSVQVINNYGCSQTSAAITAAVSPPPPAPIANIGGYLNICTGDSLLLGTAISYTQNYTYQWYMDNNSIAGAAGPSYTARTAGAYKVTVSNNGCLRTSSDLSVITIPSPIDTLLSYGNTVMCPGGAAITLSGGTAGSPESYLWFMNGQPIMSATSATYAAPATGTYRLKITDTDNGCSSFSKPVFITPGNIPEPVIAYQWPKFKTGTFSSYQWYYNGTLITGATSPTYTPKQSGVYAVVVKDVNGCSGTSANYYFAYSGVNNVSVTGSDIKIYPNPANDVVYIEAPVTVNATLYTIDGRLIQSGKGVRQFDISRFASGVYIITILDENNVIIKTDKLVKGL